MVDKKLSEFSQITPNEIAKLICLYLDENNAIKNGVVDFATLNNLIVHKSGIEEITGDKTFSGDTVFSGNAVFNKTVNANVSGSSGSCTGNSATATKATQDASGNNITDTYATKTALNGKVDLDLNNMNPSQTAKETIVGWGMPDFTAAIDITSASSYTCPSAGYLRLYAVYNGNIYYKSNLDTQLSDWTYNAVGASSRSAGNWFIVQKNEVLSKTEVSGSSKAFFYPLKGVNNA